MSDLRPDPDDDDATDWPEPVDEPDDAGETLADDGTPGAPPPEAS